MIVNWRWLNKVDFGMWGMVAFTLWASCDSWLGWNKILTQESKKNDKRTTQAELLNFKMDI